MPMNAVSPVFQMVVQLLRVLAWPLVVVLVVLLERRRISLLMEALTALLGRVRKAKLTRQGVTLIFAPEEVQLPETVIEHQLDSPVRGERK